MNWYLLQTYGGKESEAEENLNRQGYSTYNPIISVEKIRKGKLDTREESAFRGYLFIELEPGVTNLEPIKFTKGVWSLVTFGENLARVPTKIIENLRTSLPKHIKHIPEKGDIIQIHSGPFKELQAVYIEPDGEKRAFVLLTLINRVQRVRIDNRQFM